MKRLGLLLITLVLLGGCARAATPGGTITPDTPGPSIPGTPVDLEISCPVFYRDSVESPGDEGDGVTLVSDGDTGTVEREHLTFTATYLDDGFEGRAVSIHVKEDGRAVMSHLLQIPRDRVPENQFEGGHGFTGLLYAYASGGAEMQYWCTAHALRDQ